MIAVALTVSWFVAVMFSPVIGVTVLPSTIKAKHGGPGAADEGLHRRPHASACATATSRSA